MFAVWIFIYAKGLLKVMLIGGVYARMKLWRTNTHVFTWPCANTCYRDATWIWMQIIAAAPPLQSPCADTELDCLECLNILFFFFTSLRFVSNRKRLEYIILYNIICYLPKKDTYTIPPGNYWQMFHTHTPMSTGSHPPSFTYTGAHEITVSPHTQGHTAGWNLMECDVVWRLGVGPPSSACRQYSPAIHSP